MRSSAQLQSEVVSADVLVLGGGLAGCFAAIKARESGLDVVMVDKGNLGRSGTSHQVSGVLTYFDPKKDDYDAWYRECVEAGEWVVDQDCLQGMLNETTERIRNLKDWGVQFQEEKGEFIRRPGVGHIHGRNVLMTHGGFQLMSVLRGEVLRRGVRVIEMVMTTDLLTSDGEAMTSGRIIGAVGLNIRTGKFYVFKARAICTGMRMPTLSGDGKAMAFRVGCQMRNVELSYYHDTQIDFNCAPGANHLYGEGAILVNAKGERFMHKWDPVRMDRATRVVHCRAIATEELEGRGPIFLDATHLDELAHARIEKTLPILVMSFATAGLSLRKDRIPYTVTLSDHGPGGINVDRDGATTVPGLYAAGDASDHASSGVSNIIGHGMGSAIVGHRAGEVAAGYARQVDAASVNDRQVQLLKDQIFAPMQRESGLKHQEVREHCMSLWPKGLLGPVRNEKRLKEAIAVAQEIREEEIPKLVARDYHELARSIGLGNELLLLELLPRCALVRTESRGSHYREDYPERDDANWLKWVMAKKEDGEVKVWTKPIPYEKYPLKPELAK